MAFLALMIKPGKYFYRHSELVIELEVELEKYSAKKNVYECYYIHYTTHLCESYVVLSHLHTLTRFYCPVKFHVPTYARQRKHSKGFRVLG